MGRSVQGKPVVMTSAQDGITAVWQPDLGTPDKDPATPSEPAAPDGRAAPPTEVGRSAAKAAAPKANMAAPLPIKPARPSSRPSPALPAAPLADIASGDTAPIQVTARALDEGTASSTHTVHTVLPSTEPASAQSRRKFAAAEGKTALPQPERNAPLAQPDADGTAPLAFEFLEQLSEAATAKPRKSQPAPSILSAVVSVPKAQASEAKKKK